ncbi:MAG: hypothetical protein ABSG21_09875 [Spirochaetia bacterium]|jgi:hypothetical protein
MKRYVALGLLIFIATAALSAQGTLIPKSGDIGIAASVSSTANTALLFIHVYDSLVIAPQVGFYHYNYADTSAGVTTNYPGTWWDVGVGIYYVVLPFESLSVQIGPSAEFASESYQNNGSSDNYQWTYLAVNLNFRVLAMITKNLGVFTNFGAYYYSADTNDTTTSVDSTKTGFGIQSISLGVAYYFK